MDELKAVNDFLKVASDNSGAIGLGSFASAGSVIWAWLKLHKKLISDPIEAVSKRVEGVTHNLANSNQIIESNKTSFENRFKEADQLLEYR